MTSTSQISPEIPVYRIGSVPYLNVQPMLWAIHKGLVGQGRASIHGEVPRQLAALLAAGQFDTAIVPVFEYLRHPDLYHYIPAGAIACNGPVASVMLYSAQPMEELKTIYLDSSSLTSVHLFRVIAAERGLHFDYLDTNQHPVPRPLSPGAGWVVIGDPAIAETGRHPNTLDLGEAWKELTGLPFVFAAWLTPRAPAPAGLGDLLAESLDYGLKHLPQIAEDVAEQFGVMPEYALQYFSNSIQYHLGNDELAGWAHFALLCHRHGLIKSLPPLRPAF